MGESIRCQAYFSLMRQRDFELFKSLLSGIWGLLVLVCLSVGTQFSCLCVYRRWKGLFIHTKTRSCRHLLAFSWFCHPYQKDIEGGSAKTQLLSHRNMQKGTLLIYWPLDNYLDLLACDLLVNEMLLFKPNWWITQKKGSSGFVLCQSKGPALKAKPITVAQLWTEKGSSLIRYWPRKVLRLFCTLECECVTKQMHLNASYRIWLSDLSFSIGWVYPHLEFSLWLIWTKTVCKGLSFPQFCWWLM